MAVTLGSTGARRHTQARGPSNMKDESSAASSGESRMMSFGFRPRTAVKTCTMLASSRLRRRNTDSQDPTKLSRSWAVHSPSWRTRLVMSTRGQSLSGFGLTQPLSPCTVTPQKELLVASEKTLSSLTVSGALR